MTTDTRLRLIQLTDTRYPDLRVQQVQELAAVARATGALADVLTVRQLAEISPARFEAWQAEADVILAADEQTSAQQE